MTLPWVRLDTNFPSHDKILDLLSEYPRDAGKASAFVFACGICYSGDNGTDGLIPFAALPFVHATRKDAERLVAVGLWTPDPKGWRMKNYGNRNESGEVTDIKRADARRASRKANCVRWHGPECGCWKEES